MNPARLNVCNLCEFGNGRADEFRWLALVCFGVLPFVLLLKHVAVHGPIAAH